MFSYYGSKSKIVDYYPRPRHDKIIEPFAGSARYSLKYWEKDITIVDKYEIIIRIWRYLQQASTKDILSLPSLDVGDKIDRNDFDCIEQAWLLGFIIQQGTFSPGLTVSSMAVKKDNNLIDQQKKSIAEQLYKIKHWNIVLGDYRDLPNDEQTWFIDPPYQTGGHKYKESNKKIDFSELSNWCKSRNGQIIVCENTKANWMDFKPMIEMQGSKFRTTEAIWCNHGTNYDDIQQELFK